MADLPHRIEIVPWGQPRTGSGYGRQQSSGFLGGGNLGIGASAGIGDTFTFTVLLDAGTWTATLIHNKGTNNGQAQHVLGGTTLGTLDHYNGSALTNVVTEYTGITVAAPGWYDYTATVTGKNASASNYFCQYELITLRRTGA